MNSLYYIYRRKGSLHRSCFSSSSGQKEKEEEKGIILFYKECRVAAARASGPYMSRVLELNHVFYEFLLCTTKLWILILVLKSDGHSAQHKERERKLVDVTGKRGNAITY